ncbi:hypothetical protein FIBSPDRAFT_731382, partial [Athelia psychrophila]
MSSREGGLWLRRHRGEFLSCFGGLSKIADELLPVVVENVPTNFCVTEHSRRGIEAKNGLPHMSINGMKWMKPPANRRGGQKTAQLLLNFNVPQSANLALRKGIFILGNRGYTRKLVAEPAKCYKCQKVMRRMEHIVASCPSASMVCALCGKDHHADRCPQKNGDLSQHYCVNCKEHGHGSSDRLCKTYLKHLLELNKRNPGNLFKYY